MTTNCQCPRHRAARRPLRQCHACGRWFDPVAPSEGYVMDDSGHIWCRDCTNKPDGQASEGCCRYCGALRRSEGHDQVCHAKRITSIIRAASDAEAPPPVISTLQLWLDAVVNT